mmetsp:Transcript_6548/g.20442  ORF Transcript_6548/g.20442 Transcript_6548/m.20442 type:complete len:390 (-) Transcript_6548:118-1287(-)
MLTSRRREEDGERRPIEGGGEEEEDNVAPTTTLQQRNPKSEEAHGSLLGASDVGLVAEEVADVRDAVLDHGRTLQRQAPGDDSDVGRQAHGREHLRPEYARIADFGPLLEVGVVAEDLHGGLGVGVEGGLKAELGDADLGEERADGRDEVAQRKVVVGHQAFDLVELAEVRRVHGLVAEDAVDGEVLRRLENTGGFEVAGEFVEHSRGDCGGVRPEQILPRFGGVEDAAVADGAAVAAGFVRGLDAFVVVRRPSQRLGGLFHEEGVVRVACRVTLRLEQRVEVPKRRFDPAVRRHFLEAHAHQNATELRADFEQRLDVAAARVGAHRFEVVRFELRRLPRPVLQRVDRQVADFFLAFRRERRSSADFVRLQDLFPHQFPSRQLLLRRRR